MSEIKAQIDGKAKGNAILLHWVRLHKLGRIRNLGKVGFLHGLFLTSDLSLDWPFRLPPADLRSLHPFVCDIHI